MNVLILSAGTRNKIVQYFKRTVGENGKVVCTDMSKLAPALYEADKYYIVPKISDTGYLDVIMDICRRESIDAALSLIDPELSLLAQNAERFKTEGVTIIGSSYELCERALDKMQMYHWLKEHGYLCAESYDDKDEFYAALERGKISFPVFVNLAGQFCLP